MLRFCWCIPLFVLSYYSLCILLCLYCCIIHYVLCFVCIVLLLFLYADVLLHWISPWLHSHIMFARVTRCRLKPAYPWASFVSSSSRLQSTRTAAVTSRWITSQIGHSLMVDNWSLIQMFLLCFLRLTPPLMGIQLLDHSVRIWKIQVLCHFWTALIWRIRVLCHFSADKVWY